MSNSTPSSLDAARSLTADTRADSTDAGATPISQGRWRARLGTLARVVFALSHSFYVGLHFFLADVGVARFVPRYLPAPYAVNYLTGAAMLAFIVSVLVGKLDRLAALLMSLYVFLVAALVHAPKAADPMELLNLFRLANMIAAAWMYAIAFAKDRRYPRD